MGTTEDTVEMDDRLAWLSVSVDIWLNLPHSCDVIRSIPNRREPVNEGAWIGDASKGE
jgi:hypothetical protein